MSASSNNIRTHCVLRTYYLGKSGIFYVHITVEFVSIYDTSRYLASLMHSTMDFAGTGLHKSTRHTVKSRCSIVSTKNQKLRSSTTIYYFGCISTITVPFIRLGSYYVQ